MEHHGCDDGREAFRRHRRPGGLVRRQRSPAGWHLYRTEHVQHADDLYVHAGRKRWRHREEQYDGCNVDGDAGATTEWIEHDRLRWAAEHVLCAGVGWFEHGSPDVLRVSGRQCDDGCTRNADGFRAARAGCVEESVRWYGNRECAHRAGYRAGQSECGDQRREHRSTDELEPRSGTSATNQAFRFNGQAPIITLRAENDVDVRASLSDGFFQIANPTGTGISINVPASSTYAVQNGVLLGPANYYYFGYYLNQGLPSPAQRPHNFTSVTRGDWTVLRSLQRVSRLSVIAGRCGSKASGRDRRQGTQSVCVLRQQHAHVGDPSDGSESADTGCSIPDG